MIAWRITYSYDQYKQDVFNALRAKYGSDVNSGEKAVFCRRERQSTQGRGDRRNAVSEVQAFNGTHDTSYDEEIWFSNSRGERIANYPKQHSANLTSKHQGSGHRLKPMVRVLKNTRSKLVRDGKLSAKTAPSYCLA